MQENSHQDVGVDKEFKTGCGQANTQEDSLDLTTLKLNIFAQLRTSQRQQEVTG